jgi:hypothetical protein
MAIQLSGSLAITGSLVATGQIVAQTLNVQQVTSSIVYSCGSNIFGTSTNNTQTFTGSMFITGSNIVANVGNACFSGNVIISGGNDLVFRDASNYISSPATDTLRIVTANSERLRITATGIACFACQVCVPNIISTGASGGRYATFNAPTNGGYITFEAGGTPFGDLGSYCAQYGTGDATTLSLQSRTGYALALGTNSTEKVRIDTTGNLMVGSLSAGNAGTINVSVGCAGTTAGGLQLWATSAQTHYVQFGDGTAGAGPYAGYVGYAHATDSLLLGAGAATRAIISSTGVACFSNTVCVPNFYMNGGIINQTSGDLSFWVPNVGQAVTITQNTGRLGIGCTTPGYALTIESSGVSMYLKSTSGTDSATYGNFQMYRGANKVGNGVGIALGLLNSALADTEYAYIGTLIESCTNTQECGAIGFYTTAAGTQRCERMRITSGGNVGIGNTSPLAKLDILGNTDTYAGMAKIYLTDSNTNSNSRNWSIGNGGSAYGNLTFSVSAAKNGNAGDGTSINAMVINNTGNVGIGTTNPGYKLDICREGSGITGRFGKETIFGEWYVDGQRVGLQGTRSSDSAVSGFYIENPTNTGTSNFELLSFKTIGSEKMRITNCGYVGMLQTSPDTTLDIGNTTNQAVWSSCSSCDANLGENFENNIIIQAQHAPGANCAYGYPASNLVFRASNASNDIWNVGAIQGVVDPFGGSFYQGGLVFLTRPSSNSCNPPGRKTQGGPLVPILALGQNACNCRIAFFNSSVGIGTASPTDKLHVLGADNGITICSISANRPVLNFINGSTSMLKLSANGTYGAIASCTGDLMYFYGSNIGIGTTSPAAALQVVDSQRALAVYRISGTNRTTFYDNSFAVCNDGGGADGFIYGSNTGGSFPFNGYGEVIIQANPRTGYANGISFVTGTTSPTIKMRILENGNVGIGTTDPGQKLEVVGGEIKAGRVDSSSEGGQVSFGRASDNATGWYIDAYGNTSTPSLRFVDVSNSSVRMNIDGSGNVTTAASVDAGTGFGTVVAYVNAGSTGINCDLASSLSDGTYLINAVMVRGGAGINQTYSATWLYHHYSSTAGTDVINALVAPNSPNNNNGLISLTGTTVCIGWGGTRGPASLTAMRIRFAP